MEVGMAVGIVVGEAVGIIVGVDVGTQAPLALLQSGITRNMKFEVAKGCPLCFRWSWVKL